MAVNIDTFFPEKLKDDESRRLLQACIQNPVDLTLCESGAQICIAQDQYENAKAIWKYAAEKSPASHVAQFRLLEIDLLQNGYSSEKFDKMLTLALKEPRREELWNTLIELDIKLNGGRRNTSLMKAAAKSFPDNSRYAHTPVTDLTFLQKIWRLPLTQAVLRRVMSLSAVRNILSEYDRQNQKATIFSISDALDSAYKTGSVLSEFPRSPERQRPENYDNYMKTGPDPWWPWIKENSPVKDATGLSLLDVGAGPGFNGQHFQYLGYTVTAHSGNAMELAECARRGMKTIQSEMHNIPVQDASYDAAFACHVLEHSIIPYVLLLEIKRILKPGGLLYVNLPYPIEGDPALDYPECYDAEKDEYRFETDSSTGHFKQLELAYYSYSFEHHIFVLTYWQWRWLFKNAGFEHIASTVEVIGTGEFLPGETIARRQEYQRRPKNQHFILRRI
jgi:SAM-dependent methyltransferase